jgi:hypothetical protein
LLVVTEVALGLIFLALVISYVPIIYQAFSQRELRISLSGIRLKEGTAREQKLAELRATYEPFVNALADRIQVSLHPGSLQQTRSMIGKPVHGTICSHPSVRPSIR